MVFITTTEKLSRTLMFFEDLLIKDGFLVLSSGFGDDDQTLALNQTAYLTLEFLGMM